MEKYRAFCEAETEILYTLGEFFNRPCRGSGGYSAVSPSRGSGSMSGYPWEFF